MPMCAPVHVQGVLQLLGQRLDARALLQQLPPQVRHLPTRMWSTLVQLAHD